MSFSVSTQPLTIDPAAGRSAQEMSLSVLNGVDPSIYTDLIMSSGLFQGNPADLSGQPPRGDPVVMLVYDLV